MSEAIQYRDGSPADRDAILALRRAVFAGVDEEKQESRYWDWEFTRGPHGEGRIFVAEGGEGVIAHLAFVRQRYDTPFGAADGALAVDAMVGPRHRRHGVFSGLTRYASERIRADVQIATAYQVRREVLAGMRAGGWQIGESLPVLIKPLSLRRIAGDLGMPVFGARAAALRVNDKVRPLTDRDLARLEAMTSVPHPHQSRTAAFAAWRYRDHPQRPYQLDGWFEEDVLRAFVVHRAAELKGMSTRAVVDAGCANGDAKSLQSLLQHVCSRSDHEGLAAALVSRSHPSYSALRRSGFFPGPHRFQLLLQVFDRRFDALLAEPWSIAWGDTDHL